MLTFKVPYNVVANFPSHFSNADDCDHGWTKVDSNGCALPCTSPTSCPRGLFTCEDNYCTSISGISCVKDTDCQSPSFYCDEGTCQQLIRQGQPCSGNVPCGMYYILILLKCLIKAL